jgi:hypothetical protein
MIDFELDSPVVALFFFHFISFVRSFVSRSVGRLQSRWAKAEPVTFWAAVKDEKATKCVRFVLRGPPD